MTEPHAIWQAPPTIDTTASEADVELRFIVPFLAALGYENSDISPKHPVIFQAGRKGRPNEADFAIFDGQERDLSNCLCVIEAKRPNEPFADAQTQAESYALYLRALVYVVSDGITLEIWQLSMTRSSERVFSCKVTDLATNQATIEALLRRENLRAYRSRFREPPMAAVAWDVSSYVQAELQRSTSRQASVSRTLSRAQKPDDPTQLSIADDILSSVERGAAIVAGSGMGKTTLGWRLHTLALLAAEGSVDACVPFDINLPELVASGKSIVEFSYERLTAQCAGFTRAMFVEVLKTRGAYFFCDAFDRVRESYRAQLESDMALLLRDFPRCQLIVFCRGSSIPRVELPTFHLQPLNYDEQRQLQRAVAIQLAASRPLPDIAHALPEFLSRISGSALIFAKIVAFFLRNDKLPTDLKELFESWLGALIRPEDHKPTAYNALLKGLAVIALETWSEPVSVGKVVSAFDREGLPTDVLDQLHQLGALQYSPQSIELEHEALADFFRAKEAADEARHGGGSSTYAQYVQRDSFFPILLCALTTSAAKQTELFSTLRPLGLRGYLEAIRYRAHTIPNARQLAKDKLTAHVMAEITDGFCNPIRVFFPHLLPALIAMETGTRAEAVSAKGTLYDDLGGVSFSLCPVPDTFDIPRPSIYGRKVEDIGNASRIVGLGVLQSSLDSLIASACIDGGVVWAEERILTRLRFLLSRHEGVESSLDINEQLAFWEQRQGVGIRVISGTSDYVTSTDEIVEDLRLLKQAGRESLTVWWSAGADIRWWLRDWDGSDDAIRQYYLRTDAAYAEVIRRNFQSFTFDFGTFEVAPRSWRINLRQAPFPYGRPSLEGFWEPVSTIQQATVSIVRDAPEVTDPDKVKQWYDQTARQLSALGRTTAKIGHSRGGAPAFNGTSLQGIHDGKTAVLREVCQQLRRDFDDMFRSVIVHMSGVAPFE
ncbi:MAG TPA: hypothetical protein VJU59_41355 [Paraburkholderia sp.]|uniref:hypothetical protein n=1 Tax=Paraburkholderia sp. TaxID=1926495 RepID=UPI002B497C8F|nr:hypothetical protein [Paraburkholderia sp.]HKR46043.1 hypothetical protein [Paraburkholderia sp.]